MITPITDIEKAFLTLNRPFKANVINNMANACKGETDIIIQKLIQYIDQNAEDISFSIFEAKKGLLKIHNLLDERVQNNKNAFCEVRKICEAANYLRDQLNALRFSWDIDQRSFSPLETHLEVYMTEGDMLIQECIQDDIENKKEAWKNFLGLLEYHTLVLERIKASLQEVQPVRGGQNSASFLALFLLQVAKMYTHVTGKKLTLTQYDGFPKKSEAFNFAKEATLALAGIYNGNLVPPIGEDDLILAYKYVRQEIKKDFNQSKMRH